eukprot:15335257-Ditylum_brightwellii.AAC.1
MNGKTQLGPKEDKPSLLDNDQKKEVQHMLETLIFYARVVDTALLMVINVIASQQASPTLKTTKDIEHLLNYCATNLDSVIWYTENAVCHICQPQQGTSLPPPPSGPVHTMCEVLRNAIASAAEAEMGALFCKGEEL